jgi:ABC-2 type transport system permease protein
MSGVIRSAYVIARRDFAATVFSKAFIFFLLGPLFPVLLGAMFGGIGARVASVSEKSAVAVVCSPAEFARLSAARDRVAAALDDRLIIELARFAPQADAAAQEKRLLGLKDPAVRAVLTGCGGRLRLAGAVQPDGGVARQLRLIATEARSTAAPAELNVVTEATGSGSLSKERAITGQIGQMLLFFLTILLSGMLLSQLIEEKSNKIVEVIAAAVPIDALFIGKLFAMLAASVVGIVLWASAAALVIASLKEGGLASLPPPAVGWSAFFALAMVYFAMNYLLLGAVFLTIGAQASTVREVQTLSMPVTFAQVIIFGFAATAVGEPNAPSALAAAVFPLSSPMTMLARGAELPELWPHIAAIAWQMLWVVLILRIGARMFRKTVLKSGSARPWWRLRRT